MMLNQRFLTTLSLGVCFLLSTTCAFADPLPGEVLKFVQRPMVATPVEGSIYYGHDELSTAILVDPAENRYQGQFMADDFADKFDTPVVHLKWWGSYIEDQPFAGVSKFLVAFESDVPVSPTNPFSRPGEKLSAEVVFKGPLAPGSGTFTETLIRPADPVLGESLYEYNAELACPFPQKPDTVYWLKVVALVDPQQEGPIKWGWHNRDYTIFDPLASTPPAVMPGEHDEGPLPSGEPIWHFQDDAVSGSIFLSALAKCDIVMDQAEFAPQRYVFPYDGPEIISQYSKDLAFELYTVPEPQSLTLLVVGLGMIWGERRRGRISRTQRHDS